MSQTSHLKSTAITNLDATPATISTTGEGAEGLLRENDAYLSTVSSDLAASTYQLVRVRSSVKMKSLIFEAQAMSGGKVQLGLYYSDDTRDGTSLANAGTVVSGCVALFSGDIDCTSAVAPVEELTETNTFTPLMRQQPLWQAAGLASDPGGKFDIVATCHTTGITTGARLNVRAYFVE